MARILFAHQVPNIYPVRNREHRCAYIKGPFFGVSSSFAVHRSVVQAHPWKTGYPRARPGFAMFKVSPPTDEKLKRSQTPKTQIRYQKMSIAVCPSDGAPRLGDREARAPRQFVPSTGARSSFESVRRSRIRGCGWLRKRERRRWRWTFEQLRSSGGWRKRWIRRKQW